MIEKFIQFARIWLPEAEDEERQAECKAILPPRSARRMSQLGKIIYWLLDSACPQAEDAIVYATTHAESQALENYIRGLPDIASPTLFQTSVHPGGIQQALIARQQSVRTLLPMGGEAHLIAHLCQTGLLQDAPRCYLLLAEEQGKSLLQHGLASPHAYGIVLQLTSLQTKESLGRLRWHPHLSEPADPEPFPLEWIRLVERRQALRWHCPMGGWCEMDWMT